MKFWSILDAVVVMAVVIMAAKAEMAAPADMVATILVLLVVCVLTFYVYRLSAPDLPLETNFFSRDHTTL